MSTNRSRRIDRDTAEQLLGGAAVGTSAGQAPLAGHAALAGLLAAAAAPAAGDGELPGEQEALAAFREACRNPAPQARRRTMADTALARAFSAKAVAAAFAATALGGVAVAAGTGNLPAALGGRPAEDTPVAVHSASGGPSTASVKRGLGGSGVPEPSATATADPSAGPGQSDTATGQATSEAAQQLRLCHTYSQRVAAGGKPRLLLAEPLLAPLLKAAGSAERVDGYCTAVVAKSKEGDSTGTPSADATKDGSTKGQLPLPTKPERTGKASQSPSEAGKQDGGTAR